MPKVTRRLPATGRLVPAPNVARDRHLEGWPSCWRARDPGGPGRPLARKRWPPSVAQGVIAPYRATGRKRKAKATARDRNRRNAGAARQPGDPKVPGNPARGSRGGRARSPGAGGKPAPGLPTRHPRTRRTFAGAGLRGRRRVSSEQDAVNGNFVIPEFRGQRNIRTQGIASNLCGFVMTDRSVMSGADTVLPLRPPHLNRT